MAPWCAPGPPWAGPSAGSTRTTGKTPATIVAVLEEPRPAEHGKAQYHVFIVLGFLPAKRLRRSRRKTPRALNLPRRVHRARNNCGGTDNKNHGPLMQQMQRHERPCQ